MHTNVCCGDAMVHLNNTAESRLVSNYSGHSFQNHFRSASNPSPKNLTCFSMAAPFEWWSQSETHDGGILPSSLIAQAICFMGARIAAY